MAEYWLRGVGGVAKDVEKAVQWFYRAGRSFLRKGMEKGAVTALNPIEWASPGGSIC